MTKDETAIRELLCRIAGIEELDKRFGEPFFTAFRNFIPDNVMKAIAASFICSLFLSAILEQFPTSILHTFVHHIRENYTLFSFNCKMYDNIFSCMNEKDLEIVALLDKEGNNTLHSCSKNDIYEAFDFFTNG